MWKNLSKHDIGAKWSKRSQYWTISITSKNKKLINQKTNTWVKPRNISWQSLMVSKA